MALLTLKDVRLAFGMAELLDGVDLSLEPGERVCIAGRNGEGKSTLLKILAGRIQPDSGEITRRDGLVTAFLSQELPEDVRGSIFDVVAEGLGESGLLLERFHHLSLDAAAGDPEALVAMGRVQAELDAIDGWSLQNRVEATLSRFVHPGGGILQPCGNAPGHPGHLLGDNQDVALPVGYIHQHHGPFVLHPRHDFQQNQGGNIDIRRVQAGSR